jgi:RES domain-containing protein
MQLNGARLVGLAFRATSPRYGDLHRTAAMSRVFPGRFNTTEVGAVYASREPQTALDEHRRRAARDGVSLTDMHPRSLFVVDLLLHKVVDLTTSERLAAWGLTAGDVGSDDMSRCQEVAGVAAQHGAEAIRWNSATGTGQSLAIFVEKLLPGSHAEVVRAFDLTRAMLGAIERGASVTSLIPELTAIPLLG